MDHTRDHAAVRTIAILGPWPDASGVLSGGVDAVTATLARGLADDPALAVHVVTCGPGSETVRAGSLTVHQVAAQGSFGNLTMGAFERRRLLRALGRLRPDIVHAHGLVDYGLAASLQLVPHLISVHGLPCDEVLHVRGPINKLRWWTQVRRSRWCLARARQLTVPTDYARERLRRLTPAHIHTLENPVDPGYFADLGSTRPETSAATPRVVCVSRLIPRKRIEDVIDAFALVVAAHPTARLEIAGGEAEAGYADTLRARAEAVGVGGRLTFLGFVEPRALETVIGRAAILLHAAAVENAPVVLGQALAAGVPVVATHVGGVESMVRDGVTGFLAAPGDVRALAAHVLTLLGDPARRACMAVAARGDARARFHPGTIVVRARALYEEVVRSWPTSVPRSPASRAAT